MPETKLPEAPGLLSERFLSALEFAFHLHQNQARKGTNIPYLSHLLAVAGIVLEHGGTEDQAIAALLHDAIEDQGHNYPGGVEALRQKIRQSFGASVLQIVEDCTDADEHPKPSWKERKLKHLEHLRSISEESLLVAMADKLHNLQTIVVDYESLGDELWSRFNGGKEGSLWYYQEVCRVFEERGCHLGLLIRLTTLKVNLESLLKPVQV